MEAALRELGAGRPLVPVTAKGSTREGSAGLPVATEQASAGARTGTGCAAAWGASPGALGAAPAAAAALSDARPGLPSSSSVHPKTPLLSSHLKGQENTYIRLSEGTEDLSLQQVPNFENGGN